MSQNKRGHQMSQCLNDQKRLCKEYSGLVNQGATCYLNAVLQTLYMTPEYREGVKRMKRRDNSFDGALIEGLKKLFIDLDKKKGQTSTCRITMSLGIDVYKQLDAAEHLNMILNKTPEASEIFMGTMETTKTWKCCNKDASSQAEFSLLHIPFENSQDVEDALKAYMKPREQSGLFCRACNNMSQMTTNRKIISFPKRLIVQLQRRCDMASSTYELKVKIRPHIEVSSQKYELYAIVNRYGTFNSGHYNAVIKCENQRWYHFDDSSVSQTEVFKSQQSLGFSSLNACLLMYKQSGSLQSEMEETEKRERSEHETLMPVKTFTSGDATQQSLRSDRPSRVGPINTQQNELSDRSARLKLALKSEYQKEHEELHIRQISDAITDFLFTEEPSVGSTNGRQIKYNDIFKGSSNIRTVLTKAEADTGKIPSVVKFILDWTDEKANQEIKYIFPIPFQKLNIFVEVKDGISLIELVQNSCHSSENLILDVSDKILLILYGLHEANFPLDFENSTKMNYFDQQVLVNVLLTNLIKGTVFPNVLIWITSHPTAANKIPSEYVDLVTRVCDFNQSTSGETTQENTSVNTLSPSPKDHGGESVADEKQKPEETKILKSCSFREEGSALKPNLSHLRELDLSGNRLGGSGIKLLSELLEDPQCKVEKLLLKSCGIREEDCAVLSLALKPNLSHLRELDLSENRFEESGINLLSELLEDPQCKLEKLSLKSCSIGEKGCAALSSALKPNLSHLKELDLSKNHFGDVGINQLSELLEHPQCKLEKLSLQSCSIGEEGCDKLSSALRSNLSHLRELDLTGNRFEGSGIKLLSELLKHPQCKLEKLLLKSCRITEDGCAALASTTSFRIKSCMNRNEQTDTLNQMSECFQEKLKM